MRYLICVLLFCGCGPGGFTNISSSKPKDAAKPPEFTVTVQDKILTKQDETLTALAAIKSQVEDVKASLVETRQAVGTMEASLKAPALNMLGGDPAATEPQEVEGKESQPAILAASSPAVRLFVTSSDQAPVPFYCPPCERLSAAVNAGEFAGFEIVESPPFRGQRGYPAIRFETPTTSTGWGVVYGYDQNTIPTLRALTQEATTAQPVGSFPVYTKAGAILSQRTYLRLDNRAARRGGRPGDSMFSWFFSAPSGRW